MGKLIGRSVIWEWFQNNSFSYLSLLIPFHIVFLTLSQEKYTVSDWIYTPLSFYLVFVLLVYFLQQYYKSTDRLQSSIKLLLLIAIPFSLIHNILTDFVILFLERLFLLNEHLTLSAIWNKQTENWYTLFMVLPLYAFHMVWSKVLRLQYKVGKISVEKDRLLEKSKKEQYKLLSAQLNPHFLFNAMNNIVMMIRQQKNEEATNMVISLSEMLRMAMAERNKILIPLYKELNLIENFVQIEKMRLSDTFVFSKEIEPNLEKALIPSLMVQPFIENAFKHGEGLEGKACKVQLTIKKKEDKLLFVIYNSKSSAVEWDFNSATGVGLYNTVQRLKELFEEQFQFQIVNSKGGVRFELTIPHQQL